MNNYTEIILKYNSGEMNKTEREEFKLNRNLNDELRKEFVFQKRLDKVMKQSLMLEAMENDPDLIKAEILARRDIDNYLHSNKQRSLDIDFNTMELDDEVEMQKMIAKAEVEMVLSGIDDVSEVWVRNFDQHKVEIKHDLVAQQIVEFVKKSDPFDESVSHIPKLNYRITRKLGYQLAAAVLVLSLLLLNPLTATFRGRSVYAQYYQPLETNSFSLRGSPNEITGKLQEGVDYYLAEDYAKAELAFNDLRKMKENIPEVLLYSGLNHMGQGNFPDAIKMFTDLLSMDEQFVPEAQWYLGLCYVKTGENLKARSIMEILSETEGIYKKKAQLILKTLDR